MQKRCIITIGAAAGIALGAGVVASPPRGTSLSSGASAPAPATARRATSPTDPTPPTRPQAPEVKREEIIPAQVATYAVFRNGKVYKVRVPQRRFLITHADGTKGTRIEEQAWPPGQLPPVDPALVDVQPTPEQIAQMDRISNGLE